MQVAKITIETVSFRGTGIRENVVVLWTEDGKPHTLPDIDHNVSYPTQLADNEQFEILTSESKGSD